MVRDEKLSNELYDHLMQTFPYIFHSFGNAFLVEYFKDTPIRIRVSRALFNTSYYKKLKDNKYREKMGVYLTEYLVNYYKNFNIVATIWNKL